MEQKRSSSVYSPKEDERKEESDFSHQMKVLLEWTAQGRPFRKKSKMYFSTSLLILFFVEILLFLFNQYSLMLVVLSLVFVAFALSIVEPHNFHYRVSTEGVFVEDSFFIWHELYDFYFKKVNGVDVLHIRTKAFMPGEVLLTLGDLSEEKVKGIVLQFLPFREFVKSNFVEKLANWLSKTFPLEPQKSKV